MLLAARKGDDGPELLAADGFEWVAPLLATPRRDGRRRRAHAACPASTAGRRVVAVVGLGERADAASLRLAAGAAARQLTGIDVASRSPCPTDDAEPLPPLLEGAALGAYAYTEYRTDAEARR